MGYQVYMTKAGYALQAKLFAEGGDPVITRVEIGSGVLPEGTDWQDISALLEPRAGATSTAPVRHGCVVALEIEYRSDLCRFIRPWRMCRKASDPPSES